MSSLQVAAGDRILDPMITLAGCASRQRIIVAGARSMELALELRRRGYAGAAATGNCGRAAGQYDVALVDWRRRPLRALEAALDWLAPFLGAGAVLVVWVDAQKPAAKESLCALLEKRGFVIEQGIVHDCGCALAARRLLVHPLQQAA
ncbi:MAG: hypothetical protein AB1586_24845 [Pseudomonadota bacterium]|jgi:hypothetical protein